MKYRYSWLRTSIFFGGRTLQFLAAFEPPEEDVERFREGALKTKPPAGELPWPSAEEAIADTTKPQSDNESLLKRQMGSLRRTCKLRRAVSLPRWLPVTALPLAGPVTQANKF